MDRGRGSRTRHPLWSGLSQRHRARRRERGPRDETASEQFPVDAPVAAQISAVILNDNHAKHLEARLNSIFNQDHPVLEVVILDDASTDNSFDVIEQVAERRERDVTLIINERHSGSAFEQWERAVETATGEFIWIAEADDLAAPSFLSRLAEAMRRDPASPSPCDPRSIDADDRPLSENNKSYDAELEAAALAADALFEGADFLARFVSGTRLSVSAALWRRETLARALAACKDDLVNFGAAGDWRLCGEMLRRRCQDRLCRRSLELPPPRAKLDPDGRRASSCRPNRGYAGFCAEGLRTCRRQSWRNRPPIWMRLG